MKKLTYLLLTMLLTSCSVIHAQQKKATGGYTAKYNREPSLSKDSIQVEIVLFDAEDNSPINFQGTHFSLNEHPNKIIDRNRCVATFSSREVPLLITLKVHRPNKWPMYFKIDKKKLTKGKNKVLFIGYLKKNTAAIL